MVLPYFLYYLFFVYSMTLFVVQIIRRRIRTENELETETSGPGLILGIISALGSIVNSDIHSSGSGNILDVHPVGISCSLCRVKAVRG
jgi:hypothetical protein